MRLTEDIKPVTQLKTRAARLIQELHQNRRPMVITQNGKASAVMMDVASYEELKNTVVMLRLLAMSDADVAAGRVHAHDDVFRGLKKRLLRRSRK